MERKHISRRELLRTIGVAGAATWAAPVLTSLPASASVDRCRKKRSRKLCEHAGYICEDPPTCGACGGSFGSFCFPEIGTRTLYCGTNSYCDETTPCLSTSDCPNGNVCITENGCTGCSDSTGVCVPRCCTGLPGPTRPFRPRRLGRTATGH